MPSPVDPLPTPLEDAPGAVRDRANGRRVLLKREDLHETGAFKWRGALPVVASYRRRGAAEFVTASTGNAGVAAAWAARREGLRAIVYVPRDASRTKRERMEGLGATIRAEGRDLDEAKDAAALYSESAGLPFFEDGAERAQYGGTGEIAEEILDQCAERGEPPGAIVVPVGNGALLAGIGLAVSRRSPRTLRVGVQSKGAPVMVLSFRAGAPVPCRTMDTFADGLAVRVAIPRAVEVLNAVANRLVLVSERAIARAVGAFDAAGIRVEGAAAAPLAAVAGPSKEGWLAGVPDPLVLIVTGSNIDEALHRRAVEEPESFPG